MSEQNSRNRAYTHYIAEHLRSEERIVIESLLELTKGGGMIGISRKGALAAVVVGVTVETLATGLAELGEPVGETITQREFEIVRRIGEIVDQLNPPSA